VIPVVGIHFNNQCRLYYFDPKGVSFEKGDDVIVETEQGLAFAQVVLGNTAVTDDKIQGTLKPVVRKATEEDKDQQKLNLKNEQEAIILCKQKIEKHNLEMKLIRAEYAFDRSKLTFFFTADGRVDFRDLVKDLASVFRTRIELRQVGVRDETRLLGGLGACGRALCCASWLQDFVPVSIKMAKEQNISLNSAKISGICGRLMCCLKNEEDTYEYLNAKLPDVNQTVKTADHREGIVKSTNVLLQKVMVSVDVGKDEVELIEYPVSDLTFTPSKKKEKKLTKQEEQDLEGLE